MSEKMSVWVVLFLVYVLLYSIIYDYLVSEKINNYDQFLGKVKSDIGYFERSKFSPIVFLLSLLHKSLANIRNTLITIYGNKFKTKQDYSVLILKLVITSFVLFVGFTAYRIVDSKINRLAFNPIISRFEPKIDYQSTTVLIRGKSFGTPEIDGSVLMSQYGAIRTSTWTESTITFDVPLSWKPGIVKLWIAKPINYEGKEVVAISKPFEIRIIPRHSTFTKDDDLFFQQIKDLEPLTKKLNGYE